MRAKCIDYQVQFQYQCALDLPEVEIVPTEISRVFINILNNALYAIDKKKAHAAASYQPTITISVRCDDEHLEIRIADNGIGIPKTLLTQIFVPFFTTKPPGEGTGLGLSISQDIVASHRGELRVESREGEGTVFIIRLPI